VIVVTPLLAGKIDVNHLSKPVPETETDNGSAGM
jgi:hypothetical protein